MLEVLEASPLLAVFVVVALGALVGAVPFGPLRFGAAGALFVGLALGAADAGLGRGLGLIQQLGLALFVYTVGLAAGTTFLADLRRQLPLMGAAVGVLVLAAGMAVGVGGLLGLGTPLTTGTFSGALTSTPALAAATSALGGSTEPTVGYSLAYPVGVVATILVVAVVVGRTWPGDKDSASFAGVGLKAVTVLVEHPTTVRAVPGWSSGAVRMSYLRRGDRTRVVAPGEDLLPDDRVVVVGLPDDVDAATACLGEVLPEHLADDRTRVDFRRFVVSNSDLAGRTVAELNLPARFGGVMTRVRRGDLDLLARDDLVLELGDRVLAVVPRDELAATSHYFGDSERKISEFDALGVGLGMTLGLLIGLVTIPLPGGLQFSLGPAAGPLVVGMALGAIHRSGPLVWGLPPAANLTIRQIGLLLFLAAVGLASGPAFAAQAFTATGAKVLVTALVVVAVTAAALLLAGRLLGQSAPRTTGALAGLVGQPAILAYASSRVTDERIESGYAALFALGIIAKITLVQILAVF